ncbi:hypothetical protein [Oerskovia sp. USHLN155]|uniref:hypothetical protein n=1 Tax=Oerskovia sp. USHLN155 TaxID=3081288 RepID=UPI00301A4FA3
MVLAGAAACSGQPDNSPTPSPTVSESTESFTSSPTPTSETEAASANAEALVNEYYAVLDRFGARPATDAAELESVAIDKDLDVRESQFSSWARDGWTQTGSTRLSVVEVQSVNLDNSDPSAGRVPTVEVDVCFDVSGVDVVDGSGISVVTVERPDTGWIRHTVSNRTWESDPVDGWRVSTSVDLEQPPCEATD